MRRRVSEAVYATTPGRTPAFHQTTVASTLVGAENARRADAVPTAAGTPQQRIVGSTTGSLVSSSATAHATRPGSSFPRSSLKQVRYDPRGPTDIEAKWHMRSSSEHSGLSLTSRPAGSVEEAPTDLLSSVISRPVFPRGYVPEVQSEPVKRRLFNTKAPSQAPLVATTARNMYSQLSAMAQIQPRGSRSPSKTMTFPRRSANSASNGMTFQMLVNGVEQPGLSSNSEAIKRRLLEDYHQNRLKEAELAHSASMPVGTLHSSPPYYDELTSFHAQRSGTSRTLDRHRGQFGRQQSGTLYIPSRPTEACMTRSEYDDRVMDYRGNSVVTSRGSFTDYSSGSMSAMTSPTVVRGTSRYTGRSSPSSVIEELQGRFQNSAKPKEKRPILKTAPVSSEYSTLGYHYRPGTSVTTAATLASRPHHQSELTLPTTTAAQMGPPLRSINAASTVRLEPDYNGTLRGGDGGTFRGGPSFRRLQAFYGPNVNQKRYPSDNALDMTYLGEKAQQSSLMPQFYVSGRKAGTVKIQVRSRSEQASPTNGPPSSPRQHFRFNTTGGGVAFDDRVRSEQVILPQPASAPSHTLSRNHRTSSSVDGPQSEDDENLVLPSVREIIRQVEEMTLKNNSSAHNSTTSLTRHQHLQSTNSGSTQHVSRSLARSMNADQPGGAANRSQSASSVQSDGGGLSRPLNHCGVYHVSGSNSGDFYSDSPGKGHTTARRGDFDADARRSAANSASHLARMGEQKTNLPQDYQKLLEAFLEQRREIQRLRKEMADKDRLIASLEKEIHMYEPWR